MNAQQNAFLQMVVPPAQAAQRRWGVPASVSIAQAILESSNQAGWGQSELTRTANNLFGVKAEHLNDPSSYVELPTHEVLNNHLDMVEDKFQRYDSPVESFDDHARLLATARRYQPAMAVIHDSTAYCEALEGCGYSTNPLYAETLEKLIRIYDLTQFDVTDDSTASAWVRG